MNGMGTNGRIGWLRIRYSPLPVEKYGVPRTGRGPGRNPVLLHNLAAWNLYWLSYPDMEKDLHEGDEDFVADLAAETASQNVDGTKVSELATLLTPHNFVKVMKRRPCRHLALGRFFGRKNWLIVMEDRAWSATEAEVLAWSAARAHGYPSR